MHFDQIVALVRKSPTLQRLVLAFTVGLVVSCAANAGTEPGAAAATSVELGY
jgi:hypothetical protein